jgi:predicted MFS family arabinose efflux permease
MTASQTHTRRSWVLPFAATIFAMMTMQMSSLGFSPLIPAIQSEFKMTYSQVGLFTGIYGLVAMAMSIPGGLLAKRFGEKRALAGGLLVTAAGLLILSQAANFAGGLIGRTVWIIGYRVSFVCVMTAIAFTAPPALKGSAMGILGSFSSLASVIGAPFGTSIGRAFGWRNGILAFGGMALLGAVVFFSLYRRSITASGATGHHGPASLDPSARKSSSAFRNPMVWSLILLGTINMGGFSATFFVPSAVRTVFGLPPMQAAYIISTSYVVAIFANLLFGFLCDRFNRWNMMIGLALILIPACFTMMLPNLPAFWISTALLISLGLCATNQIYALASELTGGKDVAAVMGIASLGGGVFGYIGPQMLGYLRDHTGGFTAGWYFVAGGCLVSFLELLFLKRYTEVRKQRQAAQPERSVAPVSQA